MSNEGSYLTYAAEAAAKSSVGWRRWSNEYLYDVLGLYWGWKIQPLPGLEEPFVKAVVVRQDP